MTGLAPSLTLPPDRYCPDCGQKIINPGGHAERCTGPRLVRECECPPGYLHLPTCPEVAEADRDEQRTGRTA